jgi:transcriptional regulator with XRE-family HTH domain
MQNGIRFYREKLIAEGTKPASQQAVAEHIGIKRSRLSMLENGHIVPTPGEVEKLAQYLRVTPGHLYEPGQIAFIYAQAKPGHKGGEAS